MTLWIDSNNQVHDDMSGAALTLPSWPKGMTPYTPPAPTAAQLLEAAQVTQNKVIMDGFNVDSVAPVLVGTVTYNGSFDSAMKMDAAQRLMESAGAATVDFYDIDNVAHTLAFADATKVVQGVAGAYQVAFAKKQSKLVAIAQAANPAAVQAIVW